MSGIVFDPEDHTPKPIRASELRGGDIYTHAPDGSYTELYMAVPAGHRQRRGECLPHPTHADAVACIDLRRGTLCYTRRNAECYLVRASIIVESTL